MRSALRLHLCAFLFVLAGLASTLGAFTHRYPTRDDLALAQFVAMGGTASDLCSSPDPKALIDGLYRLCAPATAPALVVPVFALALLPGVAAFRPRPASPATCPRPACLGRPAIRAPPSGS